MIDRPTSLSEIAVPRRGGRVKQGQRLSKRGTAQVTQVADKTFVSDMIVPEIVRPLWMRRHWTPYAFGLRRVVDSVRYALSFLGIDKSYAALISAPLFAPLAKHPDSRPLVLDAQDNLLKHAMYRDTPGLRDYYEYCQRHCDLLFANSMETTQWLAQKRPDATHIPNGVDTDMFDASRQYARPEDLAPVPRPIIGYAGKMQQMFDANLMERVLVEFPAMSFLRSSVNGSIKNGMRPGVALSQCVLFGRQTVSTAARVSGRFRYLYHPLQRAASTRSGIPSDFYQYNSPCGKPVVTTA